MSMSVTGTPDALPIGSGLFESARIPFTAKGRFEFRPEQAGFGTEPPGGTYFVLEKPITVNGTEYDALYVGLIRRAFPQGTVTLNGEAYEYAERVAEGTKRYAVLGNWSQVMPQQQRAKG